jgi:transposase-like protein
MNRKLNSKRADLWRERLARQAVGAWSVAEFCRREGVSQPSFYQWRKRLGSTRSRGHSGASRPKEL